MKIIKNNLEGLSKVEYNKNSTYKQIVDLSHRINKLSHHIISSRQRDKSAKRSLFILIARKSNLKKYLLRNRGDFNDLII